MKKITCYFLAALLVLGACSHAPEKPAAAPSVFDGKLNIVMLSDAGRNGAYDQRRIGELMGIYADRLGPEFVISCGDLFHYDGVQSVSDPLWLSNFENIYPHGELQCPWFGVLGNHEYRGNTKAVMDYTHISRRWNMPGRYYTFPAVIDEDAETAESVRFVFIDTPPLIGKYQTEEGYPDAQGIADSIQLNWIDSVLTVSPEKWKIVTGHHPVYSYDKKDDAEGEELRAKLEPIFRKHGIDAYFCGHIHTFQHLRTGKDSIDYIVNGSASLQRPPMTGEFTVYNSKNTGFTLLSFDPGVMNISFVNSDGKIEYTIQRKK